MLGHVVRGLDLHETASVMEAVEFRPYPDLIAGNRELVGLRDKPKGWGGRFGHPCCSISDSILAQSSRTRAAEASAPILRTNYSHWSPARNPQSARSLHRRIAA